ncbi:MAG: hypothetical protein AAF416_15565 [Pseudomonadota bacterium]
MNELTPRVAVGEIISTDLTVVQGSKVKVAFSSTDAMDGILDRIEKLARAHQPDVSTAKGRKEIASMARKVASSKVALDEAGKALNAGLREQINVVDAERRRVKERLDDLRDRIRFPLTEWEEAEADRKAAIEQRISDLAAAESGDTIAEIEAAISAQEAVAIDDSFAEFIVQAAKAKDAGLQRLRTRLEGAKCRAEAARLKAIEAERRRQKAEAEAKAAEEERAARAKQEAEEAAKKAAAKAKQEAQELARKLLADQREKAEERIRQVEEQARREREAAQLAQEEERRAAEARAANEQHVAMIRAQIVQALMTIVTDQEVAEDICTALMGGGIPHTTVNL